MNYRRTAILAVALFFPFAVFASRAAHAQLEPGYIKVYDLSVSQSPEYELGVPYSVDNHASIASGSFSRVAYELELGGSANAGSPNGFVWISFDTLTPDAGKLGVPTLASGEVYQTILQQMNVLSNVPGVVTGSGIQTGNIEFWPYEYEPTNGANIPGASDTKYDFGDQYNASGNYGSMQVNNYGSEQTLFALNHFNNHPANADIGIGNNQNSNGNPDWTDQQNAGDYTFRDLSVWALPVPEPSSFVLFGTAAIVLFAVAQRRRG